eukprot:209611-Prymnesium_polylepis.1
MADEHRLRVQKWLGSPHGAHKLHERDASRVRQVILERCPHLRLCAPRLPAVLARVDEQEVRVLSRPR